MSKAKNLQPAPRNLPVSVKIMLLGGGFSSTLLLISVLLLLLVGNGRSSLPRYYHYYLGARGSTSARIVEQIHGDQPGYAFSYTVGDSQYLTRGFDGAFSKRYEVGQTVEAWYCLAHPEVAALPGLYLNGRYPVALMLGGLGVIFMVWQAISSLIEGMRIKELVMHGAVADAELVLLDESKASATSGSRRYAASFKPDAEPSARRVPLRWGKSQLKERDIVFYSQANPSNVVPLSALAALVKVDKNGQLSAQRPGQAFLPPVVFLLAMALLGLGAYYLSSL